MLAYGLSDFESTYWVKAKGEVSVLENVAYVDAKSPNKNPAGYMVTALKSGYGEKSPEERKREEAAQKQLVKNAEAREQQAQAEQAEEALKAEFSAYQKSRAQDLIEAQDEASIAALGQIVADALVIREMCQRWEAIKRDPSQLDLRKGNDKIIFGGYVVAEALKLWGDPQDLDFEEYKKRKSVTYCYRWDGVMLKCAALYCAEQGATAFDRI